MSEAAAIGIDLGTTYCRVSVFQHGEVKIIPNDQGHRTTPSCVAFTNEEILIGEAAQDQIETNPFNTIFGGAAPGGFPGGFSGAAPGGGSAGAREPAIEEVDQTQHTVH